MYRTKHHQRDVIKKLATKLGIAIVPEGKGLRLIGNGIEILTVDLGTVLEGELYPSGTMRRISAPHR
jgi:hypothetical protein